MVWKFLGDWTVYVSFDLRTIKGFRMKDKYNQQGDNYKTFWNNSKCNFVEGKLCLIAGSSSICTRSWRRRSVDFGSLVNLGFREVFGCYYLKDDYPEQDHLNCPGKNRSLSIVRRNHTSTKR